MSSQSDSFDILLAKAKNGDKEALGCLVAQYEPEIRLVARVQLGPALRPHLDSVDLVLSVHRSLMLGLRQNKFEINGPDSLIALALTMVRRKVARNWRHLQRQQRLSLGPNARTHPLDLLASLSSHEVEPEQAAERNDSIRELREHLSPDEQRLIERRLLGHSTVEVGRELGIDPDVVRVRLSRLRQRRRTSGVLTD